MSLRLVASDGELIEPGPTKPKTYRRTLRTYIVWVADKEHECQHGRYCRFGGIIVPGDSYEAKVCAGRYIDGCGKLCRFFYVSKEHYPDCFDDDEWVAECDREHERMERQLAEEATEEAASQKSAA